MVLIQVLLCVLPACGFVRDLRDKVIAVILLCHAHTPSW